MAIEAFSNLSMTISDGGTVPSLDYLFTKTFVDIGSGNVLKITWNTPTAENNAVDSYIVYVLFYDVASVSYKHLYNANVGNVNEFYLKSALFEVTPQSFIQLYIYVEAVSKYGADYNCTSDIEAINVSRGCGAYVKVEDGYKQPIMKRSVAFTKLAYAELVDENGDLITDDDGNIIYMPVSSVQDYSTGWTLMQEHYAKDANGNWQSSDIRYEVLTDTSGEIVTDLNGDTVYVL